MFRPWLRLLDPALEAIRQQADANPTQRLDLARALNTRGLHRQATELLDQLAATLREQGDFWFERIIAIGDGSDPERMETYHQDLEALRDEYPGAACHRRNLGYVRLLQQRPADAARALQQALDRDGQDGRSLELMGLLALQKGEPAEAKGWLLKALTLQPRDPRSLRLLGLACEQLGDYKGAEAQYLAALELEPAYFWGWHSLGELSLRLGERELGLRCIHHARALCVSDPASYFMVAEVFSEQGHLDLAQGELHALLAMGPSAPVMAEAQGLLGELRRDLGDREGAVSYFSLATGTDPKAATPWVALGDMAREEDRLDDALRCYHEALDREPEAADVLVQVGYVHLNLGHVAEAEKCFLAALEQDATEYSAYLGLAERFRLSQQHEEQARMVQEAMALAPEDPDVWNAHGVSLELGGHMPEAEEAYERALSLEPQHRKAANNLGFLLEKRMEAGEAGLRDRTIAAWRRRLLICRDEGQSLKMAREHLVRLGVEESQLLRWLEHEPCPNGE